MLAMRQVVPRLVTSYTVESRLTREKCDSLFWWGSWHFIGRYIVPVAACVGQCPTHAPRDRRRVVGALVILGLRCVPGLLSRCWVEVYSVVSTDGALGATLYGRSYRRHFLNRFSRFMNFVSRCGGVLSQFVNFNGPGKIANC